MYLFKPSAILIDLINIATDANFLDTVKNKDGTLLTSTNTFFLL